MSIITAKGTQAVESAKNSNLDLSKVMLRLKDGDSHKVRLLSTEDFVEYNAISDFALGVYTQPVDDNSPLSVAYAKGGEKFKNLYVKKRYAMVFGSLQTGELVAWECTPKQFKAMLGTIEEYKDNISDIAFNLKRTGAKADDTTYTLNPVLKMKPEEQAKFDALEGTQVEMDFYEAILQPKSEKFLASLLQEAGFDVATHLPHIDLSDEGNKEPDTSAEAIEESGSDEDLLGMI